MLRETNWKKIKKMIKKKIVIKKRGLNLTKNK